MRCQNIEQKKTVASGRKTHRVTPPSCNGKDNLPVTCVHRFGQMHVKELHWLRTRSGDGEVRGRRDGPLAGKNF